MYKEFKIIGKLDALILYKRKKTKVYLIGSACASKNVAFHASLSDMDLLLVPVCHSADDYLNQVRQAINISTELNKLGAYITDVFMLTTRINELHFKCLTVLAGVLHDDDIIFGSSRVDERASIVPNGYCRKAIYQAKAVSFSREYQQLLPFADTGKARKIAKNLLRVLKVFVCANTPTTKLAAMEKRLLSVYSFSEIESILADTFDIKIIIDNVLQDTLNGKTVEDWSAWMVAQEKVACWLAEMESSVVQDAANGRLYGGICQVRDMLMLGLKDIISQGNNGLRMGMIGMYADDTAGVIAKLALSGVSTLLDFDTPSTPNIIKESYAILVDHLRLDQPTDYCLAASIILLEYALEQSIVEANRLNSD